MQIVHQASVYAGGAFCNSPDTVLPRDMSLNRMPESTSWLVLLRDRCCIRRLKSDQDIPRDLRDGGRARTLKSASRSSRRSVCSAGRVPASRSAAEPTVAIVPMYDAPAETGVVGVCGCGGVLQASGSASSLTQAALSCEICRIRGDPSGDSSRTPRLNARDITQTWSCTHRRQHSSKGRSYAMGA